MTSKVNVNVCLTDEIRLEKALKEAGVKKPATVEKLTVSGMITDDDFRYIRENMAETLQELDLGDASVENNILNGAPFWGCFGLKSIIIPASVVEIVFEASATVTTSPHPDIPVYADKSSLLFNKDKSLVYIPKGLLRLSNEEFDDGGQFTYRVFSGCMSLASVEVHPNNAFYASENGVIFNKDKTELIFCPRGYKGDFVIPNSVVEISATAFFCCAGLSSVAIPNSVVKIGDNAFLGCTGLTSVTIPDTVTYIGVAAFAQCTELTSVNLPNSLTSMGENVFQKCGYLDIYIPALLMKEMKKMLAVFVGASNLFIPNKPKTITEINSSEEKVEQGTMQLLLPDGNIRNLKNTAKMAKARNITNSVVIKLASEGQKFFVVEQNTY